MKDIFQRLKPHQCNPPTTMFNNDETKNAGAAAMTDGDCIKQNENGVTAVFDDMAFNPVDPVDMKQLKQDECNRNVLARRRSGIDFLFDIATMGPFDASQLE